MYNNNQFMNYSSKPCDDFNHVNNDGCNQYCEVEEGWICENGTDQNPDICTEICGDGHDYGTYPCDDGNLIEDDGCDGLC